MRQTIYLNDLDVVYSTTRPLDQTLGMQDRIDMIKCDIDGHDYRAMQGATGLLKRCRPVVFAEFYPQTLCDFSAIEPVEFLQLFFQLTYTMTIYHRSGEPVPCGQDTDSVMRMLADENLVQLDLMFEPSV